jgi:hypothetical protein
MRLRTLVSLLALISLSLGLAACSDDPEPPAAGESRASAEPPEGDAAPEGIEGVIAVRVPSREHSTELQDYDSYPPLGGDHFPQWYNCAFYDQRIADEPAVHSMEHGAVWIAFQPDLDAEQRSVIQAAAESNDHVLASAYPDLRAPVVMTAWGRQLDLDSVDDPRFQQFIDTYVDAVAPEAAAPCSGALTPPPAASEG